MSFEVLIESLVHFLHIGAAIFWIGGMAFFFTTLIPTLKADVDPSIRLKIMSGAGRRFKHVSFISIAILVLTGLFKVFHIATEEHPEPAFWNVLAVKLVLVVFAISLSYVHDIVIGPKLIAPEPGDDVVTLRKRIHILARVHFITLLVIVLLGTTLLHLHGGHH